MNKIIHHRFSCRTGKFDSMAWEFLAIVVYIFLISTAYQVVAVSVIAEFSFPFCF